MNKIISESIVFKNGNSLAVRLVGDCKFPVGTRIRERREGEKVILEPITDEWPKEFLESLGSWDDEIERPKGTLKDPFE